MKHKLPSKSTPTKSLYIVTAHQKVGDDDIYIDSDPLVAHTAGEAVAEFMKLVDTNPDRPKTLSGCQIRCRKFNHTEPIQVRIYQNGVHEHQNIFVDEPTTLRVNTSEKENVMELPTSILTLNPQDEVIREIRKSPDQIVCDDCGQPKHLHGSTVRCNSACDGPAGEGCECGHHNWIW